MWKVDKARNPPHPIVDLIYQNVVFLNFPYLVTKGGQCSNGFIEILSCIT